MRVLQLVKTSDGAAWAVRQVRALIELGVEVHVALPGPGRQSENWAATGATIHHVPTAVSPAHPLRTLRTLVRLRRLVDTVRPDLIHSHFVHTTLAMRMALGRDHPVPRLFQVPGPLHLEHATFRNAELASAGPADWWAASCTWTRRTYEACGIPPERVGLVYYGLDLDRFQPGEPGHLRRELGIGADEPLVGMVAYMYAPKRHLGQRRGLKGHEDLIDALADHVPDARVVFAGGPWAGAHRYARRVERYGRERLGDRAFFLGTRSDVPRIYADLDVVVHPSHSENLGGAAESLVLGVPTIATDVGGHPDLVQDGVTGWLTPAKDPAALGAAIRHALDHPEERRTRTETGQRLALSLLDIRACAADLLALYDTILE